MVSTTSGPELVAIVGLTASGKSDLAMRLAKELDGEIICADSRTIYRGMDIGTAKPTIAEQTDVRHWGIDLIKPGQGYSAAKFKKYAKNAITDIQNRGKLPILVGGTGLYVDGVLYDFGFMPKAPKSRRAKLEAMSLEALQDFIREMSWPMPFNVHNRRHLVRVMERQGKTGSKKTAPPAGVLMIGLMPPDEVLKERIASRAEAVFGQGIIKETEKLMDRYGRESVSSTAGIAYQVILRLIGGEITQNEATQLIATKEWQYARRQKTWFKRDPHIKWFNDPDAAYEAIKKQLVNT
ncbi:MAG: tRNA (adenosine(37)-N6)-dimethylallyltransferase MiaA [Candidatus Saccharimonadales bacterium]|jgi:tRNA dimethylallyltransferase